jgi:hypothetical protein
MSKTTVIKVNADTGQATKSVDSLNKKLGETKASGISASSTLGAFGGQATTMFQKAVQGAKMFQASMVTLKGAIISTGIGALVIAIVAVIQAIGRLQSVTDKYSQVTAYLGTVLNKILDAYAYLGEAIIDAFLNPKETLDTFIGLMEDIWNWIKAVDSTIKNTLILTFLNLKETILDTAIASKEFFGLDASELRAELQATQDKMVEVKNTLQDAANAVAQPFIDAANAVADFAGELNEAGKRAAELERLEQRLLEIRVKQTVAQAQRNKEIAASRLIAEDELLSYEEREAALQRALDLEGQNLKERLHNAKIEAELIIERNKLSESSRADRQAEADALAKVYQLEEESIKRQKRVFTELQGLQKQRQAAVEAEVKATTDAYKAYAEAVDEIAKGIFDDTASQQEKEITAVEDKYNKLLDLAVKYNLDTVELEEARNAQVQAIQDKYRQQELDANEAAADKQKADDQAVFQSKLDLAIQVTDSLVEIGQMFQNGEGQRARRSFTINKSLAIGQTALSTYAAVMTALQDKTLVGPARFIAAASAGVTGAAQILKIKQTQFGGSSSGGGVSGSAPSGGQAPTAAPTPNFDFLQQGANQNTIQAYVLPSNVNNQLQANQKLQEQAAL